MQSFVRNGLRAAIFSGACWTAGVALSAEEELPPPAAAAVDSDPLVAETAESELQTDLEAGSDRSDPVIESAPELFEASPEVLEFTRKLNERLQISGAPNASRSRAGWSAGLRLEICPGNCPICGTPVKAAEDFTIGGAPGAHAQKRPANWLFQEVDVEHLQGDKSSEGEQKLRPGEPAQVILDLRERLGASALEGSEFTVKPDALAKLIRALDRESRQQEAPAELDTPSWTEPASPAWSDAPAPSSLADDEATISALRAASRQLDEAAELLEQQNLFERADELREQADRLRRDARGFLQERSVPQPPRSNQQTTAAARIENLDTEVKILQAAAVEPSPAEFMTFLRSAGIKGRSPRARPDLSSEMIRNLEEFLDELGQIRESIDRALGNDPTGRSGTSRRIHYSPVPLAH